KVAGVGARPPSATVLELGAGTGKLTRLLVGQFDRVVAVQPTDGLLALLRRTSPSADIRQGSAEAVPVEAGSVDAVYAAESFHWFDGPRAIRDRTRPASSRRPPHDVEHARRGHGTLDGRGRAAPRGSGAASRRAGSRPGRPQHDPLLVRRLARTSRQLGLRGSPRAADRESAGARPGGAARVLRVDGLIRGLGDAPPLDEASPRGRYRW